MNNKKVIYILIILIFCIGIYLCVPQVINFISTKKEIQSALTLADEIDIKQNDKLYNLMVQYNTNLAQGSQKLFSSENVYKEPDFLLKDNGIDNCEILGKIYIPKINIQLALYNGAKEKYMKKGAVCWGNTSLPIGGENTNSVISAHNRFYGNNMFIDIDKLEIGDDIYIQNFWNTLHYQVIDFKIIRNDDFSYSYVEQGESIITLMTCYKYPNRDRRYVVIAEQK